MKMKKILALSVCAMMALSSMANAAFYVDGDGYAVADTVPTKEQVQDLSTGYKPNADIVATAMTASEAVAFASEKGKTLNLGRGSSALNDNNSDFYKVVVDVNNLGDLFMGTFNVDPYAPAYFRLFSVVVDFAGFAPNAKTMALSSFDGVDWTAATTAAGGYAFKWQEPSAAKSYPSVDNTVVPTFELPTAEFIVIVGNDEVVDITPNVIATYQIFGASGIAVAADTKSSTADALKLGGTIVEEDKPVEFSAALAEKTDFGYIWALTFTQSADKLASFTAKFEADGVEPAERTVANASDIATALKGKTAPIVLNVGLSTTKTLTKATFTADDAVNTTEACVFEAPLSK